MAYVIISRRRFTGCPLFFNIDFPWLFHDQSLRFNGHFPGKPGLLLLLLLLLNEYY